MHDSEHDVFISYSHKDTFAAEAICHKLEEQGVRCWYAPRNIQPGAELKGEGTPQLDRRG